MKNSNYCNCVGVECGKGRIVQKAHPELLVSKDYYQLYWEVITAPWLSRYATCDWVESIFARHCCVTFQDHTGAEFILPKFEDVFSEDIHCTWMGLFKMTTEDGRRPAIYCGVNKRLEILNLAAKIIRPQIFREIGHLLIIMEAPCMGCFFHFYGYFNANLRLSFYAANGR